MTTLSQSYVNAGLAKGLTMEQIYAQKGTGNRLRRGTERNANQEIIGRINDGRMTPAQAEQLFSAAGINVAAGGGSRTKYLNENSDANARLTSLINGENAMPVGVEPIHKFERDALRGLGDPESIASRGGNSYSEGFLDSAGEYGGKADVALQESMRLANVRANLYGGKSNAALEEGNRGFDLEEIKKYFNPAEEQVTNRSVARINENSNKLQQAMLSKLSQRGSASFGDLYGAQQLGDIQKETVSKVGDVEAQGAYQNWSDAVANMMQKRRNSIDVGNTYAGMMGDASGVAANAGGTYAGLVSPMTGAAGASQNISDAAFTTGLRGLQAQQGAGARIQGFNQGVADISINNLTGRNDFKNGQFQQAFSTFGELQNPSMVGQTQQPQPNYASGVGGIVGGLVGAGVNGDFGTFGKGKNQNWVGQAANTIGIKL